MNGREVVGPLSAGGVGHEETVVVIVGDDEDEEEGASGKSFSPDERLVADAFELEEEEDEEVEQVEEPEPFLARG
jgi:hypothetical protein